MKILVVRGAGANPAPGEQVNELTATQAAGTQLGRNYLDARGTSKTIHEIEVGHAGHAAVPGEVVELLDVDLGERFRGKITAASIDVGVDDAGALALTQRYTVERSLT